MTNFTQQPSTKLQNNYNSHRVIHDRSEYIKHRYYKLSSTDSIRIAKILEMIQYTTLYAIFCLPMGVLFDKIFYKYNKNLSIQYQILQVLIQVVICSITIFYIKKIVKLIPLLFKYPKHYIPYTTDPYVFGGIIIGIVFLKFQSNLYKKLTHIRDWVG